MRGSNVLAEHSLRLSEAMDRSYNTERKLRIDDFYKKYESQRVKWERLKNSPPVNRDLEKEEKEL
jgi:hypothetical protein